MIKKIWRWFQSKKKLKQKVEMLSEELRRTEKELQSLAHTTIQDYNQEDLLFIESDDPKKLQIVANALRRSERNHPYDYPAIILTNGDYELRELERTRFVAAFTEEEAYIDYEAVQSLGEDIRDHVLKIKQSLQN